MNCERCNGPMTLTTCDNRDYWICKTCEIGFLADPKINCERDSNSIIFGFDNTALCEDCGNLIAYENH